MLARQPSSPFKNLFNLDPWPGRSLRYSRVRTTAFGIWHYKAYFSLGSHSRGSRPHDALLPHPPLSSRLLAYAL
ncbi:hypothetical protein V2G26_007260 [Clonostachys chloroleuca]